MNDRRIKNLVIANDGKFPFDFTWKLQKNPLISITPELGNVPKGETVTCTLAFKSKKVTKVEAFKLVCKITNGSKYVLLLNAQAYKPALEFSLTTFDFGACYLLRQGAPPYEQVRKTVVCMCVHSRTQSFALSSRVHTHNGFLYDFTVFCEHLLTHVVRS